MHPVVGLEVVVVSVALALEVEGFVDRSFDDLCGCRRNLGDRLGHLTHRVFQIVAGDNPIDHSKAFCLDGSQDRRGEKELLGLAGRHLPWFHQEFHRGSRHAEHWVLEGRVVAGHDQIAHAGQHHAGGDAFALHCGDGGLPEVTDT